jgi:hypothetical protein
MLAVGRHNRTEKARRLNSPSFHLAKWYLDCIADDGRAFIAYAATLRWKALVLHYSSYLFLDGRRSVHTGTSLREASFPLAHGPEIHWKSAHLQIDGTWKALREPIERTLQATPYGGITWSCLQPHAEVTVTCGTHERLQGLGYAERLEMTLEPQLLSLEELRWGRFLSPSDALVWIDWKGGNPQRLVIHNGTEIAGCAISKNEVSLESGRQRLVLDEHVVLRHGPLASTALAMIPGIQHIAPLRILRTRECKWRSRGRLMEGQTLVSSGWTIHEIVNFGGTFR